MKLGRCGRVFKMKEVIAGPKKPAKEAHAITDPENGNLVVFNSEIKKVTLNYCKKVLENIEPEEEMKKLVEMKEKLHHMKMEIKEGDDDEFEVEDEDFFQTLRKFESNGSNSSQNQEPTSKEQSRRYAEGSSKIKCFQKGSRRQQ